MNNLNVFFGEEIFLSKLENNFKYREVVFLCDETKDCFFRLKRLASKSVVVCEDKKAIYHERTPLVVLYGSENFLKKEVELCKDAKKPYFLLFTNLSDFARFEFDTKKEENVFLLASIMNFTKDDLIYATKEVLGNITVLESLAFESLFFKDQIKSTNTCFKMLCELFSLIKKPALAKVELATVLLHISKIKQLLNKKSLTERNIARRCSEIFATKNNVPCCVELVHMFQLAILKTNLIFLTSKAIKRTGYPNFFDRLVDFWKHSKSFSPNFSFALDDDVNITRLKQIEKRLFILEEEFAIFAEDIYKFFYKKSSYKISLLMPIFNDENYFEAIKLTPDYSGFCLTSIIRNLGFLEV